MTSPKKTRAEKLAEDFVKSNVLNSKNPRHDVALVAAGFQLAVALLRSEECAWKFKPESEYFSTPINEKAADFLEGLE